CNAASPLATYLRSTPTTQIYTLSLHDALPILAQLEATRASIPPIEARIEALKNSLSVLVGEIPGRLDSGVVGKKPLPSLPATVRSEEHTSELQSRENLVCRLLLEKKKQEIHNQ